jgi:hypothetical protein
VKWYLPWRRFGSLGTAAPKNKKGGADPVGTDRHPASCGWSQRTHLRGDSLDREEVRADCAFATNLPLPAAAQSDALVKSAVDAYAYFYPLVVFGVSYEVLTNVVKPTWQRLSAPVNQFMSVREDDPANHGVILPSTDTLYTFSCARPYQRTSSLRRSSYSQCAWNGPQAFHDVRVIGLDHDRSACSDRSPPSLAPADGQPFLAVERRARSLVGRKAVTAPFRGTGGRETIPSRTRGLEHSQAQSFRCSGTSQFAPVSEMYCGITTFPRHAAPMICIVWKTLVCQPRY